MPSSRPRRCGASGKPCKSVRMRRKRRALPPNLTAPAAQTGLSGMDSRKGNIAQDIEQAEQQLETEQQALLAEQNALDACCQALEMAENQLAGVARKAEIRQKKVEERTETLAAVTAEVTDTGNRIRMLRIDIRIARAFRVRSSVLCSRPTAVG